MFAGWLFRSRGSKIFILETGKKKPVSNVMGENVTVVQATQHGALVS